MFFNKTNQCFPKQQFKTERFFSRLNKLQTGTIKNSFQGNNKVIKISNLPVNNGYLSSNFGFRNDPMHGSRRLHKGIDIAANYGTPVNPLGEGMVIFAGYKTGYGNTVEIKHGNSLITRYAHLSKFLVDEGQQVNVG